MCFRSVILANDQLIIFINMRCASYDHKLWWYIWSYHDHKKMANKTSHLMMSNKLIMIHRKQLIQSLESSSQWVTFRSLIRWHLVGKIYSIKIYWLNLIPNGYQNRMTNKLLCTWKVHTLCNCVVHTHFCTIGNYSKFKT